MKRSNDATCYLRQVRRYLVCPLKYRRKLMCRFRADVDAFSERVPSAEYEQYVEQFGSAKSAADDLLCSLPRSVLRRSMNAVPFCAIAVAVLAVLLIGGYVAVDAYIDSIPYVFIDYHYELIDGTITLVEGEHEPDPVDWRPENPPGYPYHSENAQ